MHMTSGPYLLIEDRTEFDRLLDEALRTADERPELAGLGERLNAEQLRTMALSAIALLTAAAGAEYAHYVKVREELRDEALTGRGNADVENDGDDAGQGEGGAGVSAVVAVLAPVLAGTAMLIFLLVGYCLKAVDPEPAFARTLLTAGWLFGGLTVVALVFAVVSLLVAALRNSSTEVAAEESVPVPDELARAREAWRNALLERGIMPFLRDALADPTAGTGYPVPRTPGAGRIPHLGYTRPDFSSPSDGAPAPRPGYTGPDFTSPDFGGPEHRPE
ncbi:membrane protein [Streptomyces sp. RSD-27]|nr:membrane protein [Streptomyces sp. RSD-27]